MGKLEKKNFTWEDITKIAQHTVKQRSTMEAVWSKSGVNCYFLTVTAMFVIYMYSGLCRGLTQVTTT